MAMRSSARSQSTLNERWAAHEQNRLGWAFKAYERFVKSLSPEIRERLAHKNHQEEAYVVVFGKTQVGKTTLLMDLMGVSPAAMERVSTALRGGRAHGHSATATTMEYRRSEDQRWGLRVHEVTRWFVADSEITTALGDLRERMERGELLVDSPCVVSIPANCFVTQADQGPVIKMLDLPGDQPANPVEREHVHNMARRYVPLADLILLVGRGDDLSFLQPGGLTLPGIEDWQSVPGRFRIITTYSFTPQSIRDFVRQNGKTADPQVYRRRLIEQIEKFAPLSDDAKTPRRYFPLEFGKSWISAKASQPKLYSLVSPMIDELKSELHRDIQDATTSLARLNSAVEARVVIKRVKENKLSEMETIGKSLRNSLERDQNELEQVEAIVQRMSPEHKEMSCRLAELTFDRLQDDLKQYLKLSGSTLPGDPGERVSGFKLLIWRIRSSLKQRVTDSRPDTAGLSETAWFWRGVKVNFERLSGKMEEVLDSSFNAFESHISDYTLDKYWFKGSSSDYQADICRLKKCMETAEFNMLESSREWWLEEAKRYLEQLHREHNQSKNQIHFWHRRTQEIDKSIKAAQDNIDIHEKGCEAFKQRMELDLKESNRFSEILDSEYLHELKSRRQIMHEQTQPTQTFIDLLAALQLIQTRQKLIMRIETCTV